MLSDDVLKSLIHDATTIIVTIAAVIINGHRTRRKVRDDLAKQTDEIKTHIDAAVRGRRGSMHAPIVDGVAIHREPSPVYRRWL